MILEVDKRNPDRAGRRRVRRYTRLVASSLALLILVHFASGMAIPVTAMQTTEGIPAVRSAAGAVVDVPVNGHHPAHVVIPAMNTDSVLAETIIPEFSATAGFVVDITAGVLLYQYQPDVPVAPASTLKMVTALVALTVLDSDEIIEIAVEDLVDTEVYSNAQLQQGDLVSVEELLAGLLIPSGGDAAKALARIAGERLDPEPNQAPVDRFVEEMNRYAVSIGMQNSNFVNPDGPDHPDQFTTARDIAIAGAALLEDALLADIVAREVDQITITGPNARVYDIVNTNELLGVERVHGIKTGTTGHAGESVVLATRRQANQVITVVMGSEARYVDTQLMLQYVDDRVRWVEFGASDDFPGVQRAAERFGFVLAVPRVQPMLRKESNRLHSELNLGPRPRGTLPVRWGHVVFFQDSEELYRMSVLRAGNDR